MSDEIFFDGVRYISAGDAALSHDLSRDYVAKLCREGKVQGKRVGKNWYASEAALKAFLVTQEYHRSRRRESLSDERTREYNQVNGSALTLRATATEESTLSRLSAHVSRGGESALEAVRGARRMIPSVAVPAGMKSLHGKVASTVARHGQLFSEATRGLTNPGLSDAAARSLTHVPLYSISPVGELLQKATALTLACMLTFGTYALVDQDTARFAIDSARESVRGLTEDYVDITGGGVGKLAARTEAQVKVVVENPGASLAAAAGFFPDQLASFAKAFNAKLDELVYAVAFPTGLVERQLAGTTDGARVAVEIQPYARPAVASNQQPTTNSGGSVGSRELGVGRPLPRPGLGSVGSQSSTPTTVINQPVIERIVERVVPQKSVAQAGGLTEAYLTQKLGALENKLSSQMYALSNANSTVIAGNYVVTAQTNRINELTNVEINNPTLSGGTISNTEISGSTISNTSISASTLSVLGNATFTSATTTNFFATTASSTNLFSTFATSTYSFASVASSTALFATAATSSSFFASTLRATTGTFDALSVTGASSFGGLLSLASSTIGNGLQAGGLTISGGATTTGNAYFAGGLGIGIATSSAGTLQVANNAYVGGNLFVGGNSVTLGNSSSNSLTINSSINSHLIPNQNITYDLGSPSFYWRNVYVGNIVANNISAASTTIAGTASATFTINSDNVSSDAEDADLIFFRGNVVPNALLSWKSGLGAKRFEFNQSTYISNQSGSTTQPTLRLQGVAGQTGNLFEIASSTGTRMFSVDANGATLGNGFVSQASSTVVGNFTATGNAIFGGTFSVGTTTLTNLSVTNTSTSTFAGGLALATLAASGATTLSSTLSVAGNTTLANATSTAFFASVASSTSLYSQAASLGALSAGTLVISSTLNLTGLATLSSGFVSQASSTVVGNFTSTGVGTFASGAFTGTTGTTTIATGQGFTIGGSQFVLQQGSGHVGIGTTTPWARLAISTADNASANQFVVASSSAVSLMVAASGNVGIGTTSPAYKLAVGGTSYLGDSVGIKTPPNSSYALSLGGDVLTRGNRIYGESTTNYIQMTDAIGATLVGYSPNNSRMVVSSSDFSYYQGSNFYAVMGVNGITINAGQGLMTGDVTGSPYGRFNITGPSLDSSTDMAMMQGAYGYSNSGLLAFKGVATHSTFGARGIRMSYLTGMTFYADNQAATQDAVFTPTPRMILTNAGLFGVGTTTPWAQLSASSTSASPAFAVQQNGAGAAAIFSGGNVGVGSTTPWGKLAVTAADNASAPQFVVASSSRIGFIVSNTGNVGINTATPGLAAVSDSGDTFLTVKARGGNRAGVIELAGDNGGNFGVGNPTGVVQFTNNVSGTNYAIASIRASAFSANSSGQLHFLTASAGSLTNVMTIHTNQNVGIGTTTPNNKLAVVGTHNTTQVNLLELGTSGGSLGTGNGILFTHAGQSVGGIRTLDDGSAKVSLRFDTYASSLVQNRMIITGDGNVGIGTTTPAYKLDVFTTGSSPAGRFTSSNDGGGTGLRIDSTDTNQGIITGEFDSSGGPFLVVDSNLGTGGYLQFEESGTQMMRMGQTFAGGQNISALSNLQIAIDSNNDGTGAFEIAKGSANGRVGSDGTALFRINNDGGVGIGTTTFAAKNFAIDRSVAETFTSSTTLAQINRSGAITNNTINGLYNTALKISNTSTSAGVNQLTNVGLQVEVGVTADFNSGIVIAPTGLGNANALTIGMAPINNVTLGINGPHGRALLINNSTVGSTGNDGTYFGLSGSDFRIVNQESAGGIQLVANNDTAFSAYLSSAGRFGVSSSTPWGKLAVTASDNASAPQFVVASSSRIGFIVANSGNVGINTATPGLAAVSDGGDTFLTVKARGGNRAGVIELAGDSGGNYGVGNPTGAVQFTNNVSGTNNAIASIRSSAFSANNSGQIHFLTAAAGVLTNAMTIHTNQNVGIGSTTPWAKLSVKGAGTTTGVNFQTTNSSDSPLFTILDSGNVGIGTTSPSTKLAVAGGSIFGSGSLYIGAAANTSRYADATGDGGITLSAAGDYGNGTTLQVSKNSSSGWSNAYLNIIDITSDYTAAGNRFVNFYYDGGSQWSFRGDSATNFYINREGGSANLLIPSGNVGIGTTTPWAQLSASSTSASPAFAVQQNGAGAAAIFSGGNVGIGTTNPTGGKLQIADGNVALSGTGSSFLGTGPQALIVGHTGFFDFNLQTNGVTRQTITAAGNVGIGTTTPWGKLSVTATDNGAIPQFVVASSTASAFYVGSNGRIGVNTISPGSAQFNVNLPSGTTQGVNVSTSQDAEALVFRADNTSSGTSARVTLQFNNNNNNSYFTMNGSGTATSSYAKPDGLYIRNTGPGIDLAATRSDGSINFWTGSSPTNRMTIGATGFVGIGDTTPDYLFEVASTTSATYAVNTAETWAVANIFGDDGTLGSARGIQFQGTEGTRGAGIVGVAGNTTGGIMDLGFIVSDSNVYSEAMRISSTGRVGIGTTTPSYSMDIMGTSNQLRVSRSGVGGWGTRITSNASLPTGVSGELQLAPAGDQGSSLSAFAITNSSSVVQHAFFTNGNAYHLGSLGIGTTTPSAALHIGNGISIDNWVFPVQQRPDLIISTTSSAASLGVLADSGNTNLRVGMFVDAANDIVGIGSNWNGGSGRMDFKNGSTNPNISITAAGSVGINDTTADYKFETTGTAGSGFFAVTNSTDGDIFAINSSGNVGIGSTTPSNKLSVGGGSIDVDGTGGGYKIDNAFVLRASTTRSSIFVGTAGNASYTAPGNVGIGSSALAALTTGNSLGGLVAVGTNALASATSSFYSVAVGTNAMQFFTEGAVSGDSNSGQSNVAVGWEALKGVSGQSFGVRNVAIGERALRLTTTGSRNTSVGYGSLGANTTGSDNIAVGTALTANTIGTANVALGTSAISTATSSSGNVAVGWEALRYFTGAQTGSAFEYNTAVGYQAIAGDTGGMKGTLNTGVGSRALSALTTGGANTAIGWRAGLAITTGSQNAIVGLSNAGTLTTGSYNTVIGSGFNGASADVPTSSTSNFLNIANMLYGVNTAAGGSVGIGTSTPQTTLAVSGGSLLSGSGNLGTANFGYSGSSSGVSLGSYTGGYGAIQGTGSYGNAASYLFLNPNGGSVGFGLASGLGSPSGNAFSSGVGIGSGYWATTKPTNGLIVEGNVGIGTTTPNAKLAISGTGLLQSWNTTFTEAGRRNWGIATEQTTTGDWQLQMSTAMGAAPSSAVITANSSGYVGIGTAAPSQVFSVAGTLGISEAGSTGGRLRISTSGSGAIINQNDNSNIFFQTQGTTHMTVQATTGNVGIGNTSPSQKFMVSASDSAAIAVIAGATKSVRIGASSGSGIIEGVDQTGVASYQPLGIGGSFLGFQNSGVEYMRLTGGNLGIGTTNPTDLLMLATTSNMTSGISLRNSDANSSAAARITLGNNSDAIDGYIQLNSSANISHGGARSLNILTNAGDIVFSKDRTSPTALMTIKNSGNVGIGTTTPINKFHVLGSSSDTISTANLIARIQGSGGNGLGFGNIASSPFTSYIQSGFVADLSIAQYSLALNPLGGNVGIGTTTPFSTFTVGSGNAGVFNGAICADNGGNTKCYGALTAGVVYGDSSSFVASDVAENYFASDSSITAGEIVSLDVSTSTSVKRASKGERVLGIVSTQPGVLLGDEATSSVPVALSGRVPVKVSLENGPIQIGDTLSLSATPGVAKRAKRGEATIGIALENYLMEVPSNAVMVFVQNGQEQDYAGLAALMSIASSTEALASGSLADSLWSNMLTRVTTWFASATNGIGDLFANRVRTKELCVEKSDGSEICVTGDQLAAALAGTPSAPSSPSTPSESGGTGGQDASAPDTEVPVITVSGANPATIEIGQVYSDLGATVFDAGSPNIGITASVNGGAATTIEMIVIDTSATSTNTIIYSATDQAGNTGTATRTVNVVEPSTPSSPSTPSDSTDEPTGDTATSTPPVEDPQP